MQIEKNGKTVVIKIQCKYFHLSIFNKNTNLIDYINYKTLNKEVIGDTFRKTEYQYPKIAKRETIANKLVNKLWKEIRTIYINI